MNMLPLKGSAFSAHSFVPLQVDGPNKSVTDKDCVKLAWMIARFAPSEVPLPPFSPHAGRAPLLRRGAPRPQVREISLPRNDISTAGVTALAQLLRLNTSVVGVNLHENNINDEAAVIFAKMLSFNTSLQAPCSLCATRGALPLLLRHISSVWASSDRSSG